MGLLGVLVLSAALIGLAYGISWIFILLLNDVRHPGNLAMSSVAGLFLLFLSLQGTFGVAGLETRLARYYLGPSHHEELERRIEQLATSRAGVIAAVNDERRRIERDLHDGVQQRLVALGMLLGRALRSQDGRRAEELLRQAHEESGQALTELREVAWRVYPTVLDEAGLRAALKPSPNARPSLYASTTHSPPNPTPPWPRSPTSWSPKPSPMPSSIPAPDG